MLNKDNIIEIDFSIDTEKEMDQCLNFFLDRINESKYKINLEKINIEHAIIDFEGDISSFEHRQSNNSKDAIRKYLLIIERFKKQLNINI